MKKTFNLLIAAALFLSLGTAVQAATYTDFTSGDIMLTQPALSPIYDYVPFMHYREFDFSSAGINEGTGVTNGDVVQLFNVLANTIITEFGIRPTTASLKSGTTAEVGDGDDPDGYVGHANISGLPYIKLDGTQSGVSVWRHIGLIQSGASEFMMSGVSVVQSNVGDGITSMTNTLTTNHGPYFTSGYGQKLYTSADTIDMTFYVDKAFAPGTSTGVTPVFEAYIKGFKRVVP